MKLDPERDMLMRVAEEQRGAVVVEIPGEAVFFGVAPWPTGAHHVMFEKVEVESPWADIAKCGLRTQRFEFGYRHDWFPSFPGLERPGQYIYTLAKNPYNAIAKLKRVYQEVMAEHDYNLPPHWKTLVQEYWRLTP